MISLICLGLPVQAGNYTVTYSGGSTSSTSGPTSGFSLQQDGWTGTVSASGSSSVGVQVNGTITATFNWVPDPSLPSDPAPAAVIVTEHCTASGGGYAYYSQPTVSASDGFGDAATIPSQSQTSLSKNSTGFRSSAKYGASFTVTCSPSVNVSGSMCSLSAGVSYSAVATPAVLNLRGVLSTNGSKNILIGQGVTASVDAGNIQQTAWAWSISGDPFAGFVLGSGGATGHAVELAPDALTKASVPYFYRSIGGNPSKDESHTASTITCTVTVANQNANLAPFQVTVTDTVNVYQPAHTFKGNKGRVVLFVSGGAVNIGAIADGVSPNGIDWKGSVTTPSIFVQEQGVGTWNYTQLIQPSVSYTQNGVVHKDDLSYGLKGLDDSFPYAGPYMADGTLYETGDNPSQPLTSAMSRVNFVIQGWTWMLYQPPAYDSTTPTTFVPLHEFDWTAAGFATCDGISWTLLAGAGISITDIGPTSVLPDWTQIITPHPF